MKFKFPTYKNDWMIRWLVLRTLSIKLSSNHPIIITLLLSFITISLFSQTTFVEKSEAVGINHYFQNGNLMGGGAAVFDFNKDGWEDIWINGGTPRDVLYQNKGNGTFKEIGREAGLAVTANYRTTSVIAGDIDKDGFRDVFITTREDTPNLLFRNNGDGTFTDITEAAGLKDYKAWSTTASFADINLDGYVDLYVGNYVEDFGYIVDRKEQILSGYDHECQPNYLFLNNQDGTFREVGADLFAADEGCALASTLTDFDNDGDVDVMVVNDYGQWVIPNNLLINQQMESKTTSFVGIEDSSDIKVGFYAMGVAIGDYDKDQDLDYYLTNIGRNALIQNLGQGQFKDTTNFAGVENTYADSNFTVGWGTAFLDVDNDTDLDLFVANGFISALSFNRGSLNNQDRLFINQGYSQEKEGVTFVDQSAECGIGDSSTARGLAKGDFDNDGDMDILVVRVSGTSNEEFIKKILYYENQLDDERHWLKVKIAGFDNQEIYGTHARIVVGEESWLSEINGGSSHASQHSSILHFGLGTATQADSLIIHFLGGQEEVFTNILANQQLSVQQPKPITTNTRHAVTKQFLKVSIAPNPATTFTQISLDDFSNEPAMVQLIDITGKVVFSQSIKEQSLRINQNNLPKGIYFLQVTNSRGDFAIDKIVFQ